MMTILLYTLYGQIYGMWTPDKADRELIVYDIPFQKQGIITGSTQQQL